MDNRIIAARINSMIRSGFIPGRLLSIALLEAEEGVETENTRKRLLLGIHHAELLEHVPAMLKRIVQINAFDERMSAWLDELEPGRQMPYNTCKEVKAYFDVVEKAHEERKQLKKYYLRRLGIGD